MSQNLLRIMTLCFMTVFIFQSKASNKKDIVDETQNLYKIASPNTWAVGDTFIYLTPKLNVVLRPAIPVFNDTTDYYNQIFTFEGIKTVTDWHNNSLINLEFSNNGKSFTYSTNKSLEQFADSTYNPLIGGLYRLQELIDAKEILIGEKLYILTDLYKSLDGKLSSTNKKFVEVEIKELKTDSIEHPVEVVFTDENGDLYSISTRFSNTLQAESKSNFSYIFSRINPREKYKDIKSDVWEVIKNGQLKEGMTKNDVVLSIGRPNNIDKNATYTGWRELWQYDNGTVITFHDGRVIAFRK